MKCTDPTKNSKLLLQLFVTASHLIKPSLFTSFWDGSVSVDFISVAMLGSHENSHHFFSWTGLEQLKKINNRIRAVEEDKITGLEQWRKIK